jgi:acyl-CoA synthetase (AMP-forming)/AMP-acid ligase II
LDRFGETAGAEALVWNDRSYPYGVIHEQTAGWIERLVSEDITGSVVVLRADFSPSSVALLLALMRARCIVVPWLPSAGANLAEMLAIAQAEIVIEVAADDTVTMHRSGVSAAHSYYDTIRERGSAGLVLFSSGATGQRKAAVHDFSRIVQKFRRGGSRRRMITFLRFDHIGGVNTLFHVLSTQGTAIVPAERSADAVLAAVEKHRAEVLPTSPTFLTMIVLSEAYRRYDLSSLRLITYGTEPMPHSTLQRLTELFPSVTLKQTYGLSEVGILSSKSKDSSSLWIKIGGEGFATRIVDGILQIKASSAMLGYLNAPSPFTDDGWFVTGDVVEVQGEYIRILGRHGDLINVGGEKVYPAEVESVLQAMPNISECCVYGEQQALTGHIVCADVVLIEPEDLRPLQRRLHAYCSDRLERFKVPLKVRVVSGSLHTDRFKKTRIAASRLVS